MQRFGRSAAFLTVVVLACAPLARAAEIDWDRASDEAVQKLQAYVRIDTTNPPGNETPAAELLRDWLQADGIEARLYDVMDDPRREALVARLPGTSGKTIVLMSHSDVVPAIASEWSHPPFAADITGGEMFGRGTGDTKGLGVLELMTMVLMKRHGITPRDDILLLIEPDEEEQGKGAKGILATHPELFEHTRMVLNEGGSGTIGILNPGQIVFFVQTAEKGVAWMKLTAHGDAGHGSVPRPNNAVVTMVHALDKIAAYETPLQPSPTVVALFATLADQLSFPNSFVMRHVDNPVVQSLFRRQLTERPLINALLRTTISLTGVHGGYKTNVIPAEVDATLDCRVTLGDSAEALKHQLEKLVDDPHVEFELTNTGKPNQSPIDPSLMDAIRGVVAKRVPGSIVAPIMSSGVTDSAYFREHGIPAYGFVPIIVTEPELGSMHGTDERISLARFREAVPMYYEVIAKLEGVEP